MKKRVMCAVIASAMIAANAMSAVVYAEGETASASESSAKLTRGVYAAYTAKDDDGKYDDLADYYIFDDETAGHTSKPQLGIGVPFSAEQDGASAVFHFGGADDTTKAEIEDTDDGELLITFTYDSGDKMTYKLVFLAGADPDTFSGENDAYADEDTAEAEAEAAVITRGVWAAHGEDNEIVDYYIFDDETQGHTAKPDNGLGIPFSIEQNGDGTALFHFASAEFTVPATIGTAGDGLLDVTLIADSGSVTYKFELLPDEDPDTFMSASGEALLTPGVYGAFTAPDGDGLYTKLDTFFVFTSESEGYTSSPIMGIGLPFSIEQNGQSAVFHFASADDNSPASVTPIENTEDWYLNIQYADGTSTKTYYLKKQTQFDAGSFNGASAAYGLFFSTDEGLQLYNANEEFSYLTSNPRADEVGLAIAYADTLTEGFDIDFVFTTADKDSVTYNLSYDGEIDNDTILVDLDELLAGAGVAAENIVSFTVCENKGNTVYNMGFVTELSSAAKITIESKAADVSAENETNPATGVSGFAGAGFLAAAAGAAAVFSRKRR